MEAKQFKTLVRVVTAVSTSLLLAGCMSTSPKQPLTPEQAAQAEQMRSAFIARLQAGTAQLQNTQAIQQATSPAQLESPSLSTAQLTEQMQSITATGGAAKFNVERDGILINDMVYLDPEGVVERAGWNVMTGNFTYTLANFDGSRTLKFYRAGSSEAPMIIGTVYKNNQGYRIETVDGQVMAGSAFIPTSNGVIVSRGSSAFEYKIGDTIKGVSIPRGWSIAKFQKGDVDSSGLILLERDKEAKRKAAGFGNLLSDFSEMGRSFGLAEIFDYALYDISSNQIVLLNMSLNDKQITVLKNCVRQNDYLNKCSDSDSYDSLYENDGRRNRLHYFWSLDWFNTPAGPMAVYNSGTK
jgi:outer membrane murein-binding lipoprotein Lpp